MALRDYAIPTREVSFPGGSFTLRGLSFNLLAGLFADARDEMLSAMEAYENIADGGNEAVAVAMVQQFPVLVAKAIARAAGEPEAEQQAADLPFPVQTEALVAIAELTFTEPDALKKFLGHVQTVMAKTATLAPAK